MPVALVHAIAPVHVTSLLAPPAALLSKLVAAVITGVMPNPLRLPAALASALVVTLTLTVKTFLGACFITSISSALNFLFLSVAEPPKPVLVSYTTVVAES